MKYKISNTPLVLREFGRNIQSMIEQILLIESREERTRQTEQLVRIIQQLHPQIKDNVESKKYLWDNIFIMSNYKLDVDSPFPMPDPKQRAKPPQRIPYKPKTHMFAQYGTNVEVTLNQAAAMPDSDKKWDTIMRVVAFMRQCLEVLDKESYLEKTISKHIYMLTNGKLNIAPEDLMPMPRYDMPPPPIQREGNNGAGRNMPPKDRKFDGGGQGAGRTRGGRNRRGGSGRNNGGGGNINNGPRK